MTLTFRSTTARRACVALAAGLILLGIIAPALSKALSIGPTTDAATVSGQAAATDTLSSNAQSNRQAPPEGAGSDAAEPYFDERKRFVDARDALARGDRARFIELEASLSDYPLHDFLVYERLRNRWRREKPSAADIATVQAFQQASGDRSLTRRLAGRLQTRFAETRQWQAFLELAESPLGRAEPCQTLQAREALSPAKSFDKSARELWASPSRQNAACTAALDALEARVTPPVGAIWERINAAMAADRPERAEPMLRYLATRDREPVERWIAARSTPRRYLESGILAADNLLNRRVLADLVRVWSKDDVVAAMQHWQAVNGDYSFTTDQRYDTTRALAMRAAYRRLPEAQGWLADFDARDDDLEAMEWRVRTALLAADWPAVLGTLARLPAIEQAEDHWRYWEARAYEQTGRVAEAEAIHEELAALQSWHGFLSAERVGRPYAIEEIGIDVAEAQLVELAGDPALIRAREFHRVNLAHEGRRVWNDWIAAHDSDRLAAAAVLASHWGLDDRAIFSAGRADRKEALSLRFPVLYREQVDLEARENRIEPALIYGVMRRESAYIADIRSGAGAIGLMQLMPATAKDVARMKGLDNWRGDLTDPATNIAFGSFYFRHVLDRFDDHAVLATASYNAGPHRVKQWLPTDEPMEADRWVDTIPYTETRRYVRAVLAYAAIYEKRLSGGVFQLGRYLLPVPTADQSATAAAGG